MAEPMEVPDRRTDFPANSFSVDKFNLEKFNEKSEARLMTLRKKHPQ
jgi:hypothetical protein